MSTNQKTISADQDRAYEALKLATLNILDVTSANTNEETKRYAIRRAEQLVTRAKKLLDPDVKKVESKFEDFLGSAVLACEIGGGLRTPKKPDGYGLPAYIEIPTYEVATSEFNRASAEYWKRKYKVVQTRLDIELGTGETASHWKRKYEEAQTKLGKLKAAFIES